MEYNKKQIKNNFFKSKKARFAFILEDAKS